MKIIEKGQTISISASHQFPFKKILLDAGIATALVWGVFVFLVGFLAYDSRELRAYFIALTLLLIIPLISGVLIRHSRHYGEILIDGQRRLISLKSLWRKQQVSFDDIKAFQVNKYRIKPGLFLYRLEAALFSGKPLRLIQDVPDKQSLHSFGIKIEKLVKKPLSID